MKKKIEKVEEQEATRLQKKHYSHIQDGDFRDEWEDSFENRLADQGFQEIEKLQDNHAVSSVFDADNYSDIPVMCHQLKELLNQKNKDLPALQQSKMF